MKYSATGAIIGGVVSGMFASLLDNMVVFFIGVLIGAVISGFDKKFLQRGAGLLLFYIFSGSFMFLHTVIFHSFAVLGWIFLIFYSIIIIPLYFGVGFLVNIIIARVRA